MLRRARELAALQLLVAAFSVLGCTAQSHPQSYPDLEQRGSIQATRDESTIDTVVRFRTEMRADSALSAGQLVGTVVSASSGAPIKSAQVWLDYPDHRHTTRFVITDTDGQFDITGLPADRGMLHSRIIGFRADSVAIDERLGVVLRFALRVNPFRIQY